MSGSQEIVELIKNRYAYYEGIDRANYQNFQKVALELAKLGEDILPKLHDALMRGELDFNGSFVFREVMLHFGPTHQVLSTLETELCSDTGYDVWGTAIGALLDLGDEGKEILIKSVDYSRSQMKSTLDGDLEGEKIAERCNKEDQRREDIATGVCSHINDKGEIAEKVAFIPLLLKLAEDDHYMVHGQAIRALGCIDHPAAASVMLTQISRLQIDRMETYMEALQDLCVKAVKGERWPQILSMMERAMGRNEPDEIRDAGSLALSKVADKTDDPGLLDRLGDIAERYNDITLRYAVSNREKILPPQAISGTLSSGTVEPPKNVNQNGIVASSSANSRPANTRPMPPPLPPKANRPTPPPLPQKANRPTPPPVPTKAPRPTPPPLPPRKMNT